ncbi:MAG: hypothetical protein EU549_04285, partial [Promethearchaeota archaeon]
MIQINYHKNKVSIIVSIFICTIILVNISALASDFNSIFTQGNMSFNEQKNEPVGISKAESASKTWNVTWGGS